MSPKYLYAFFTFCLVISSTIAVNQSELNVSHIFNNNLAISGTISGTTTVCLNSGPVDITFTGSGGEAPYTFTYTINGVVQTTESTNGDQSSTIISYSPPGVGIYEFVLTSVSDNSNPPETIDVSESVTITVTELPNSNFTYNSDNLCSGDSVSFFASATEGGLTYTWNFGDVDTSNQKNPNYSFDAFGCGTQTFNVTLTVTDSNDCSSTTTHQVIVLEKPNISFEDRDAAAWETQFENCNAANAEYTINVGNTSISNNCVSSYSINWGDGNSDNNISFPATHTYLNLGSFNMTITAIGNNGCNTQITYVVKNSSNPSGGIVTPGNTVDLCTPITALEFAISSWGENPPDTIYEIDYGDGTTLTLSQNDLVASSYYNSSNPSASENFPIPHTYNESNCPDNSFTIILDITTSCGASNLTAGPITILEKPDVSFSIPDIECVNVNFQVENTSSTGYNPGCTTGASWYWDMGDGTTYTDFEPIHAYSNHGTYTISLYAENSCGTTETVTNNICIEPPLVPDFTLPANEGCFPLIINPINTTDISESCDTPSYNWTINYTPDFCGTSNGANFINSTTANSENPEIQFNTAGVYELILSATNSCGTIFSLPQTINVKSPPTVNLNSITDFCDATIFTPISTVDSCGPNEVSYNWIINGGNNPSDWTFINGSDASSPNPDISFITPNTYSISLEVTSDCGTTTDSESFIIYPVPSITNVDLSQTICEGNLVEEIVFQSNDTSTTFAWTTNASSNVIGEISAGNGNSIPAHSLTLSDSTTGTVEYVVTPTLGSCEGSSLVFLVTVLPAPTFILQPEPSSVCLGGTPNLLTVDYENGTGTPTYQWYENDTNDTDTPIAVGTNSNTFNPPVGTLGFKYYYCVISFPSNGGCDSITSDVVLVEVLENVNIDTNPISETICVGGIANELTITNSGGAGNVSYQWYSNTTNSNVGGTLISGANTINYTPPASIFTSVGDYYYYVEVSLDGNGCSPAASQVATISVVNDPTVSIQPTAAQILCEDAMANPLTVTVSGGIGTDYIYQWYSTSDINSVGNIIVGAISDTYTPATNIVGILYYYCVITQPYSGCESSTELVSVTVNQGPSFILQPEPSSVCLGGTPNLLTVDYENGTGTPTYQWYENDTNDTDTPIAVGTNSNTFNPPIGTLGFKYYYCVISFPPNGGCDSITSDIVLVEVVENVNIDTNPFSETICVGGTANELTSTHSGGAGDVSYQWYSNTTNSNVGGTLISGANTINYTPPASTFTSVGDYYYYLEVSLDGNGCSPVASQVATISVVNDPTVSIQPTAAQILCEDAMANPIAVTVSGGIGTDYNYQWYSTSDINLAGNIIVGAISHTYTPLTNIVGTLYYYCVVTQPYSGCESSTELISVTINLAPNFELEPISETICLGENLNDLVVSVINGAGAPTYQWYFNTIDDQSTSTPIASATGNIYSPPSSTVGVLYYFCIVNFNFGDCPEIISTTAEITINQVPVISNYNDLICSDNSFGIIPNNVNGDIVPSNTTYTWTTPVINPAGSVIGASEEIAPQNTISQNLINTTINPATVIYTVTPTSGICVGNDFNVTITVNPSISVDAQLTNSPCFHNNLGEIEIDISGGVPFNASEPYQINWIGPNGFSSTQEDIQNLEPGDYMLTINDAGGCPFSETYTITEPEELVLESTDVHEDISCFGEDDGEIAITINGGTEPYTYSWSKDNMFFGNSEDISNLESGMYILTITDANNCELILNPYAIIEPPLLTVNLISQTNIECFGEATGSIEIDINGGRPNYQFAWVGPNSFTSNIQNISDLEFGTYTVTVTDESECTETLVVTLTQNEQIVPTITTTDITCYNANDASIIINNIAGGVAPYSINWSNFGEGLIQDNLSAGTYILTISDDLGCEISEEIVIDEAPIFIIDPIVQQISCFNENDASITLNLVGGFEPVTVDWSDDPNAGVERNNLPAGTYSVTITDSNPSGSCQITEDFEIFEVLPLEISGVVNDALDCDNVNSGSINLSITGGTIATGTNYIIEWSNGAASQNLVDVGPGHYYVTVTDNNGCEINGDWEIIRFEPIQIEVETETTVDCDTKEINQVFVASASGGVAPYQYNWSSGTVSGVNNEIMTTNQNGLVVIEITDSYGCSITSSHNVQTPSLGELNFSISSVAYSTYGIYSVSDPIQFSNETTGDYISISWDFGDGNFSNEENPIHIYTSEDTYIVTQTVTYPFGCVYTHYISLIIEKGYKLIMPNAFTPNEDNVNDYFAPVYIGLFTMQLDIYDTWGSLIYSENGDSIQGWDGKINNNEAENGNYYFNFTAKTFYNKEIKESGAFIYIK